MRLDSIVYACKCTNPKCSISYTQKIHEGSGARPKVTCQACGCRLGIHIPVALVNGRVVTDLVLDLIQLGAL